MKDDFLCPSAPLYAGSRLLGVVTGNSQVDILSDPIEIDEVFVEAANTGKVAEQKFRFVNKCLKGGCQQWSDNSCGVIKRVLDAIEENVTKGEIPDCSIRSNCRWFSQESYNACKVCTTVKYI
jgi:hypothetical protein